MSAATSITTGRGRTDDPTLAIRRLTRVADPSLTDTVRPRLHARRATALAICLDGLAAALVTAPQGDPRLVLAIPLVWVVAVGAARGYERRVVLPGWEDARRIVRAGLGVAVMGAALSELVPAPLPPLRATTWVLLAAATTTLALAHRGMTRVWRHRVVEPRTRVVVAGRAREVRRVVSELRASSERHLEVVGVCVPRARTGLDGLDVTVGLQGLPRVAVDRDVQAVIVLPCPGFPPKAVRRLGWQLAEAGVELFVAPGLVDVDGHRTTVFSTGEVSMVHVRPPELHGPRRLAVELAARSAAAVLVVLLAPLLLGFALLVRLDSPGPAFYRQVRIGRRGVPFVIWKFRTMETGADTRLPALCVFNDGAGPLFKMHADPRITRVGRWLRRYSVDELPQLFNVVLGSMTLVGPRPALPSEVEVYDDDARRRLAVKPGITGLWQVSGRSDLSWEQATRLDLHYVDNWSLLLDLRILARTVRAVLRPEGAY